MPLPRSLRLSGRTDTDSDVYALHSSPAWEETEPLTAEALEAAFERTTSFTVGVEEELMLVDPDCYDLAPAIDEVLPLVEGDPRFTSELRSSQLEIVTPVCTSAAEACGELAAARRLLMGLLVHRYRLLSAGTHPTSSEWGAVTERDRYRQIADEYTWAALRSLACGLHVHVAVPGADRALAVFNALRGLVPELAALGANSPFFEGRDTGMSSIRPKLNELFPRSGVPPALGSWAELADYLDWARTGGLFPDATHLWWELRPHPEHGTIELRAVDSQTRVEDAGGIVALYQALAAWLADRFDAGEELPAPPTPRVVENSWRAYRYGVRGWLVDLETGQAEPTRDRLARLLDEVEPYAERLGSRAQLDAVRTLLAGNGADRQRYVEEREGLEGVPGYLVGETEASALDDRIVS
jgi:glutamate---cysteine ligase / carboxylate-amine ligase